MKKLLQTVNRFTSPNIRDITRWVRYPPVQEYILPFLFRHKPCPILWLSRKRDTTDLFIYSQYFHPAALVENTLEHNFMKYHAKVLPLATPPPWFDDYEKKCEIASYGKVIEALLDFERENRTDLPAEERCEEYKEKYNMMLERAYDLLCAKYKKVNPDLIPIMDKEKEYLMKSFDLSRDERRALETIRKKRLLDRAEEMKREKIITAQEMGPLALLRGSKNCYEFYSILNAYIDQDQGGTLTKLVQGLGMDKMVPNDKSGMAPEEQFNMRLDELYDVSLKQPELKEEIENKDLTANL